LRVSKQHNGASRKTLAIKKRRRGNLPSMRAEGINNKKRERKMGETERKTDVRFYYAPV